MVRDFRECVQAQVCWDLFLLLSSLFCATEDNMHEALLYAQWGSFSPEYTFLYLALTLWE